MDQRIRNKESVPPFLCCQPLSTLTVYRHRGNHWRSSEQHWLAFLSPFSVLFLHVHQFFPPNPHRLISLQPVNRARGFEAAGDSQAVKYGNSIIISRQAVASVTAYSFQLPQNAWMDLPSVVGTECVFFKKKISVAVYYQCWLSPCCGFLQSSIQWECMSTKQQDTVGRVDLNLSCQQQQKEIETPLGWLMFFQKSKIST